MTRIVNVLAAKADVEWSTNANESKSARMTNAAVEARIVMTTTTDAAYDATSNAAYDATSDASYDSAANAADYSSTDSTADAPSISPTISPSDVSIDVVGDLRLAFAATEALIAHALEFESVHSNASTIVGAWIWETWILFVYL